MLSAPVNEGAGAPGSGGPERQSIANQRGIAQMVRGKWTGVARAMEQIVLARPNDLLSRSTLTAALSQTQRASEAQQHLEQLLPVEERTRSWPQTSATLFMLACLALASSEIGDRGRGELALRRSTPV